MLKQLVMKTKIIKTEIEYNEACKRIYSLINSSENPIDVNSEEGEEIELLSLLVEKYEQEHFTISAPNPIEAIKFRMEQMNIKQADIAPLFGGKTRISEVLHGKRALTIKMIILLNKYLGIPYESLLSSNNEQYDETELQKTILKIQPINSYLSDSSKIALA